MSESENWEKSGCFSIFIWCLPTIVVPFIILIFIQAFPIGLFISFFMILWSGYGWAISSVPPERRISTSDKKRIWFKVIGYTLAQCIIVPTIIVSAVYGICMVSGVGKF